MNPASYDDMNPASKYDTAYESCLNFLAKVTLKTRCGQKFPPPNLT